MSKILNLPSNDEPKPETRRITIQITHSIGFAAFADACRLYGKDPEKEYKKFQGLKIAPPLPDFTIQPMFMELLSKTKAELFQITI